MAATMNMAPKPLNWLNDPMWIEIETDLVSGWEALEPNLSCYVKIEKTDGSFIGEFNAPYDLYTAKTDFDLSGIFEVYPIAPADGSVDTSSQGISDVTTQKLKISFNDMYGEPAVKPVGLTVSSEFVVIYGGTPYWYGNGLVHKSALLHSYYDTKGNNAVKELRKWQPEYVYIYSHDGSSVAINVELLYTDGTSTTVSKGSVTCAAGKVSWVNVGWNVLNMDATKDPAKIVNSYIVSFNINGSDESIIYTLDDHDTDYDQYILYDNGLGGCEVLRCSGRHKIGVKQIRNTSIYPVSGVEDSGMDFQRRTMPEAAKYGRCTQDFRMQSISAISDSYS